MNFSNGRKTVILSKLERTTERKPPILYFWKNWGGEDCSWNAILYLFLNFAQNTGKLGYLMHVSRLRPSLREYVILISNLVFKS
jgi:hypothetical protein